MSGTVKGRFAIRLATKKALAQRWHRVSMPVSTQLLSLNVPGSLQVGGHTISPTRHGIRYMFKLRHISIDMHTRHYLAILSVSSLALLVLACGSAEAVTVTAPTPFSGSPADSPVSEITETTGRIWLEAPTGVFQTGWATLAEESGSLKIEIQVAPSEAVAQPVHIHHGTCDQLGVVEHRLKNVIGGHSLTSLPDLSVSDVATGGLAINVHLSFADFSTFTACGEIPALP